MKKDKDKLDRELILRSIFEKWNPICLGCHRESGGRDCPLCQEYKGAKRESCPVHIKTGMLGCDGTPYEKYVDADFLSLEEKDAAEEEVEFLISLLDEETQENLEEIFILWCKIKEAKDQAAIYGREDAIDRFTKTMKRTTYWEAR